MLDSPLRLLEVLDEVFPSPCDFTDLAEGGLATKGTTAEDRSTTCGQQSGGTGVPRHRECSEKPEGRQPVCFLKSEQRLSKCSPGVLTWPAWASNHFGGGMLLPLRWAPWARSGCGESVQFPQRDLVNEPPLQQHERGRNPISSPIPVRQPLMTSDTHLAQMDSWCCFVRCEDCPSSRAGAVLQIPAL